MYKTEKYTFDAKKYEGILLEILDKVRKKPHWDENSLHQIQTKYPKDGKEMFSKNQLIKGYRYLVDKGKIQKSNKIIRRIRMKPIRTLSGVAPVTVLTKPWSCPGKCIYCPNEPGMPKSYIESEPGAQRAAFLDFDPYLQTAKRIKSLQHIGHNTEKIELIVLGGSWSAYPENYKRWFIKRCFDAMNDPYERNPDLEEKVTSWEMLKKQQEINEKAKHKCVGLSLETRPDLITKEEVIELRRYGCTKVQIGVQTLNDEVLIKNERGHTSKETKNAFKLLRLGGFKIHAHWMVNLYGNVKESEVTDFEKLWTKPYQPDELKIYPTSVIENTKLEKLLESGEYIPYSTQDLIEIISKMKIRVPPYCRITRIIRDIPSQEILAGNKISNLRQIVKESMQKEGRICRCIRCREIRKHELTKDELTMDILKYETDSTDEYFLSFVTKENKIAGFLRLSIPLKSYREDHFIDELKGSAIIREIHIYGRVVGVGKEKPGKAQHLGLGKELLKRAENISSENGLNKISVISAIGTRDYYKKRGFFRDKENLYMHKDLTS